MKRLSPDFLFILLLTLIVSFCSIIYELVYSQTLTVLYGGTVARYSITIGLYLVSLGLGSFFYNSFRFKNTLVFFWWIELLLSLAGPLGVLAMFQFSTAGFEAGLHSQASIFYLSHVPIVIVGILSGVEIPLLVGLLNPDEKDKFSKILGLDYIGSFLGTVVYSIVLYPQLGLIATALWVGFLNFLSMGVYTLWKLGKNTLLKWVSLLLLILYAIFLFFSNDIQSFVLRQYRESEIRFQYASHESPGNSRSVHVTQAFSTPYQDVTLYEMSSGSGLVDHCLNLDSHTQICDSTYQLYHSGLVDVPMLFLRGQNLRVLVIGGGDWIAVDTLLKYPNVASIDLVDIDGQFMEFMKNEPHFKTLHHDAYKSKLLKTAVEDGYSFMRFNSKKYDLILIDLPGIRHDNLSHLYSVEFYHFIYRALSENGVVSGWMYGALGGAREHYKVLMNTLREAGFKTHILYDAYQLREGPPKPAQPFYLLSKNSNLQPVLSIQTSDYLNQTFEFYRSLSWIEVPCFPKVRPNTVIRPNYDIIVGG